MASVIDPRTLVPLERLFELVIDLPVVELGEGEDEVSFEAVDVLELAAAAAAFRVYAQNVATGRIAQVDPGQLDSCKFHLHTGHSLAIFAGEFEPFGGSWPACKASDCEELVLAWRASHGLEREPRHPVTSCDCGQAVVDEPEQEDDGMVHAPLYGLLVEGPDLEDAADSIRREHVALGRGELHRHVEKARAEFPPNMNTRQLARYLDVSDQTPRRWRMEGTGPPFIKLGGGRSGHVIYRKEAVDAWLRANEG